MLTEQPPRRPQSEREKDAVDKGEKRGGAEAETIEHRDHGRVTGREGNIGERSPIGDCRTGGEIIDGIAVESERAHALREIKRRKGQQRNQKRPWWRSIRRVALNRWRGD